MSGLFALALLPRLYQLGSAPPGLNGDEIYNIIDARRIGWGNWPIFLPGNNGREALYFYPMALSLRLLGDSVLAVRLPSVLFGAGSAALTYLTGKELFNHRVGLAAGLFVAVALWPVMPSRIGLRAISLTFFTALTVLLLARGVRRGQRTWLLAGGVALGLTMYTYIPGRVFPAVIAGWAASLWVWRRPQWRANRRSLLLAFLFALVIFAPFGLYMLQQPHQVNQRIYSMENALQRAQRGEPEALLGSIGGVLKMFSFRGDDEWRYHLADEPVFDRLSSLFFYGGLALAVAGVLRGPKREGRQPAYLLLLLWLGAMLAPNAVLNENPSFLRAAGAITPTYLLLGLGLDGAHRFVRRRRRGARLLMPLVVVLLAAYTLRQTWQGYFGTWVHHPEVREAYNAELAAIGRFLQEEPRAAQARLFVASGYAYDNTTAIGFSFFSDADISWFSREQTFVWPDGEREAWYLLPARSRLPASALEKLQAAATEEVGRYEDGAPAFTLYRVAPQAVAWQPRRPAQWTFENGLHLVGYDMPETMLAGEAAPVTLHWQAPGDEAARPNRLTYAQVHLRDAAGAVRAREEILLGYPQAGWQAGDRFVQELSLALPEGILPGPASLAFELRDDRGRPLAIVAREEETEPAAVVRARPLEAFSITPEMTVFDEALVLRQATFRPYLTPGTTLNVALDWVALERPAQDYRVQLQLVRPGSDEPLLQETFELWPGQYPPTSWQAQEAVTTFHALDIPLEVETDMAPELRLRLLPAADGAQQPLPVTQGDGTLSSLEPDVRQRIFDAPPVDHSVNAQFDETIELLGYELDTNEARPGGEIRLTLVWRALERVDANYTVFNHIVDGAGQMQGQLDSPPVGEAWLTNTWLPDEVIVEERAIPLADDAAPGPATLLVGLYTAEDQERAAVTVDGQRLPGDQVPLAEIEIR